MGVRILREASRVSLYKSKPKIKFYLPNLPAALGPFVVYMSLDAMADIPTQSSNPSMCSLLQFYLVSLTVL